MSGTISKTVAVVAMLAGSISAADYGLKQGDADLQSAGALAFGPDGILFVGDSKGAAVFAFETGESQQKSIKQIFEIPGIGKEIAAVLGTTADDVLINDLAVSPGGNIYLSVSRGRGPDADPVILKTDATGTFSELSFKNVKFAKAQLPNAPAPGGKGRRNRRAQAITDLAFVDDQLFIAGLSNEEFASNLRSVPFPFREVADGTSVEIYHAAHGNFETRSPVRTFVPFNIDDQPHLLAAYTCTPLVKFPVSALNGGQKVRGVTIAELGNRNRPLDMIVYEKDGKRYLLIANSSRGIMKVSTDTVANQASLDQPVRGGGTAGVPYETIKGLSGVVQLDRMNDKQGVLLVESDKGLSLETFTLP
ncbi:MAG: hypothetical protein P8N76_11045 [Pirellulaceae bacterium]|nr:hypothetical protein [Pirellulaceae bacterium]